MRHAAGSLCVVICLFWGGFVHSQTLTAPNNNLLAYGCAQGYTITNVPSTWTVTQVQWSWKYDAGGCGTWSPYTNGGTSLSFYYIESIPGTFEVKALITYTMWNYVNFPPTQTTGTATVSVSATVPKPDGFTLSANPLTYPNQSVLTGPPIPISMPITCKGVPICSVRPGSYVKENLTHRNLFGAARSDLINVGDPTLLYLNGTSVVDVKRFGFSGGIPAIFTQNNGAAPFYSFTQELILYIPDTCGNFIPCSLGTMNVTRTKTSATTYTLTLTK